MLVTGDSRVELTELIRSLSGWAAEPCSTAELVDRIAVLERLKSACCAAQAQLSIRLLDAQADAGSDPGEVERSVGAQIGLARRESPVAGRAHLGVAQGLARLPQLRGCLARGETNEYRVQLVLRELACLSEPDQAKADELVAEMLPRLGNRQARAHAAGVVARLDQEAALARIRGAVRGRRVTIRPLPDAMAAITAVVPMISAVAVYAGLRRHVDAVAACGDSVYRTRDQIMADEFLDRLLVGRGAPDRVGVDPVAQVRAAHASAAGPDAAPAARCPAASPDVQDRGRAQPGGVDQFGLPGQATVVHVQLVMTDRSLFDDDDEPALIPGQGPIPAALARRMIAAEPATTVFLRRLYTEPTTGRLVRMDRRRRLFPEHAKRFLLARDQVCRTPWCDAPIRHHDHIAAFSAGGSTLPENGQGLCANCNQTKQAPGWRCAAHPDKVLITTPTGHRHTSRPPRLPHSEPWQT